MSIALATADARLILDKHPPCRHNGSAWQPVGKAIMPTITVRNIPPDVYELLKQSAAANRRSISSEVIACLEWASRRRELGTQALLARARALRRLTQAHPLTDRAFRTARRAGRP
jgi:hypothetical protein